MLDNSSNNSKIKILLAEDDGSMRRFIEIILQRADYDVSTAEDGLAAMQIALENSFDAVIADAVMPNLTGFDLCRLLRENQEYSNKPIIILSGMENESQTHLADAYLVKGSDLKDRLLDKLSSLLNREKSIEN